MHNLVNDLIDKFYNKTEYYYFEDSEDTKLMIAKHNLIESLTAHQLDLLNDYAVALKKYQYAHEKQLVNYIITHLLSNKTKN